MNLDAFDRTGFPENTNSVPSLDLKLSELAIGKKR
jgi:hypothetical protein